VLVPLLIAAALICAALTGCASNPVTVDPSAGTPAGAQNPAAGTLCAQAGQVDRLTMSRADQFPQNHTRFTFPAKITITSARRAQAVARALCALPLFPHGTFSCPADFGVSYQLSFASGATRFPVVSVDPGGCEQVSGLGATRWARSAAFWQLLGSAAGIPHPSNATFSGAMTS
jgi:hypothetical protein